MEKSNLKLPSYQDILNILEREQEIRFSSEYLEKCSQVANEVNGWIRISREYQEQLVEEAGFIHPIAKDIALNMLRRAQYLGPIKNNPIVQNMVYINNNKANQGKFRPGDSLENTTLYSLDGTEEFKLKNLIPNQKKPTIIFAGSHT